MASPQTRELVLTLSCPDRPGIVHAVSGFLAERQCNILDSQQYGSPRTSTFFLRVHFDSPVDQLVLAEQFRPVTAPFAMDWDLHESSHRPNVLVMASREGHCLNDLLYRWRAGYLPGSIAAVVSNHTDLAALVSSYDVAFHHLPVTPDSRAEQERLVLDLVAALDIGLVVLARYMQVLSAELCVALPGRIINIH
ncbi:MAG: formyltetrahydrofolate deformylase, partial [Frankiaceae bacterium]|nr:formyltetrahydrofolate deformylase [Frankiaceae bacterium]